MWPNRNKVLAVLKLKKIESHFYFASGDRMLKPLLINHALKPRALKDVDFDTLPVN